MMKFAVATLAALALFTPLNAWQVPSTGNGALAKEVQDFVDLIPMDKIKEIVKKYVANDAEVQGVIQYVKTTEFRSVIVDIEGMPEVRNLMNYMQGAGLDIYKMVNAMNKRLGLDQITPLDVHIRATGGVRGMLDEIEAILPMNDLKAMYRNKMASSKVWSDFMAQLTSHDYQNAANKICKNDNFLLMLRKAKAAQINVDAVINMIERVMGVKLPCSA